MKYLKRLFAICLLSSAASLVLGPACRAEDPKDILWFGNSFTNATCCGSTRSVPNMVSDIAVAAGHPAPRNRNASVDGQTMQWHLTNNTSVITTAIPLGENWENVVLQDYSTWPTHVGNLPQHLSSTLAMYQKVALRSPNVVPVMYETWARGYANSFYAGASPAFPGGPAQMQQELRDGYHMSTENINMTVGMDIAKLCRRATPGSWPIFRPTSTMPPTPVSITPRTAARCSTPWCYTARFTMTRRRPTSI